MPWGTARASWISDRASWISDPCAAEPWETDDGRGERRALAASGGTGAGAAWRPASRGVRPRGVRPRSAGRGVVSAAGSRRRAAAGFRRRVRSPGRRRGDGGRCQPCSAADRARGRPRRGPGRRHDGAPLGRVPRRSRGRRPAAGGGRRGDGDHPGGRTDAPLVRGRERQRGDARPVAHHRGGRQRHHVDRGHAADGGGPVRQRRGDRPAGAARRLPRRARYRQRPDGADVRGLGEPRGRESAFSPGTGPTPASCRSSYR